MDKVKLRVKGERYIHSVAIGNNTYTLEDGKVLHLTREEADQLFSHGFEEIIEEEPATETKAKRGKK